MKLYKETVASDLKITATKASPSLSGGSEIQVCKNLLMQRYQDYLVSKEKAAAALCILLLKQKAQCSPQDCIGPFTHRSCQISFLVDLDSSKMKIKDFFCLNTEYGAR